MKFIEGDKIYLTPMSFEKYGDDYFNQINLERNRKGLWSGYLPKTKEDLKLFIESNNNSKNMFFAVCDQHTDTYVGTAKLGPIDWKNRNAEIGRFLGNESYRGKGIGSELTRLLLKYAFNDLNLNKITVGCVANNIASQKSNKKAGFVLEGTLRNHFYEEGKYHDVLRFGILKSEFKLI